MHSALRCRVRSATRVGRSATAGCTLQARRSLASTRPPQGPATDLLLLRLDDTPAAQRVSVTRADAKADASIFRATAAFFIQVAPSSRRSPRARPCKISGLFAPHDILAEDVHRSRLSSLGNGLRLADLKAWRNREVSLPTMVDARFLWLMSFSRSAPSDVHRRKRPLSQDDTRRACCTGPP